MATLSSTMLFLQCIKDESGAELVEWVIVVSLIVVAAAGIYALLIDSMGTSMTEMLNSI